MPRVSPLCPRTVALVTPSIVAVSGLGPVSPAVGGVAGRRRWNDEKL
jgi:hypothetical protein